MHNNEGAKALSLVNQLYSFSERGANLYVSETHESFVFFKRLSNTQHFQFAFNSNNYPSVEAGVIEISREELISHVKEHCQGWYARKNELGLELNDGLTVVGYE